MRKILPASLILALVAPISLADDVTLTNKIPYRNITVVKVERYSITYNFSGQRVTKGLDEVRTIQLTDQKAFNQAEELMARKEPEPAKAVALYDKVGEGEEWLKRLVQYRRIIALNAAAMTDRVAKEWLAIMDADDAWVTVIKLQPKNLAPKGSDANAEAIKVLAAKLPAVRKRKEYASAVQQALMRLYRHEGMTKEADALANALAGRAGTVKPAPGVGAAEPVAGAARMAQQLEADRGLIRPGQTAANLKAALGRIQASLDRYEESNLPAALLLSGKARRLLSETISDPAEKKKILLAAGLDVMRVVAHFPGSADVQEALLEAGRINAALGNSSAAKKVLNEAAGGGDPELARQAKDALAPLK